MSRHQTATRETLAITDAIARIGTVSFGPNASTSAGVRIAPEPKPMTPPTVPAAMPSEMMRNQSITPGGLHGCNIAGATDCHHLGRYEASCARDRRLAHPKVDNRMPLDEPSITTRRVGLAPKPGDLKRIAADTRGYALA